MHFFTFRIIIKFLPMPIAVLIYRYKIDLYGEIYLWQNVLNREEGDYSIVYDMDVSNLLLWRLEMIYLDIIILKKSGTGGEIARRFNSWWEQCKNQASCPLQGTVNGGAVSKWPHCQWDIKHNQPTWENHVNDYVIKFFLQIIWLLQDTCILSFYLCLYAMNIKKIIGKGLWK